MTHSDEGNSEPLRCPDCHTSFFGMESVACQNGHRRVLLDWWNTCECGHDAHYDMTTFCLTKGCGCEAWTPSQRRRQVTRRAI
jgi:hypothetical protein